MTKAIFFDIDGTLVSFNTHRVPQSTIDAIGIIRKKGIKVIIATGRHIRSINNLGDLQFDAFITLNGSYCFAKNEVIYQHSIPQEDILSLVRYQEEKESFPCVFVRKDDLHINYKDENVEKIFRMLDFPEPPVRPLSEMTGEPVFQLISFFKADQEERIMPVIPGCESTRWNPLFTDVVPKGSSKSVGMDKILAYFSIPLSESMAFGDGGNDIPMLRHAETGIAMGNAADAVKQAADYVTDTVDNDGISKALQHFGIL